MLVYSQLKVASLENLSADPVLLPLGRVFFDTVLDRPKIKISSGVKQLLFKDDPVIIGTNGTASTNVKLHRAGTGIAQAVLGDDVTAEGSQATTLAQFGFKPQSFTDAGKPTFGQVGRIIWISDLTKLQYDNGSTWVDVGSLANPMTTGGDLIYGGASGTATRLANGTAGQFLQSQGTTLAPVWSTPTLPTTQRFTSGSGTYTTPANVRHIRIRMVGGGGGGAGSGVGGNGGAGGAGGATTFGTSLLTANGGAGGTGAGGQTAGGAVTVNGPAVNRHSVAGASGGGIQISTTNVYLASSQAGNSFFGGAGSGQGGGAGSAAAANSGSGGAGGGSAATTVYTGASGAAGGYVEAYIASPSATYSYAVGAAGTAGTAGTSGFAGGAGGAGIIVVEEYYI